MLIQPALATLVLRDIHQPPAPPWWPPAPGWWLLAAALLLAIGLWSWFAARRRKRRRMIAAVFDDAVRIAPTPADQIAAMSELLRRAARRRDPDADRLQGEAWLEFLDRSDGDAKKAVGPAGPSFPRTRESSDLKQLTSKALDDSLRLPSGSSFGRSALRLSRVRGNDEQEKTRGRFKARDPSREFSQGPGRLLLEGAYRRDVDPQLVAELKPLARACFLEWMAAK